MEWWPCPNLGIHYAYKVKLAIIMRLFGDDSRIQFSSFQNSGKRRDQTHPDDIGIVGSIPISYEIYIIPWYPRQSPNLVNVYIDMDKK